MRIKVAIVILNWNGKAYLERFLPSIVKYSTDPSYSIVVADNCSSDDSLAYIRSNYPQIEIIVFNKNHGFARGYALALPQIDAEYYVLLNSDVEVQMCWFLYDFGMEDLNNAFE